MGVSISPVAGWIQGQRLAERDNQSDQYFESQQSAARLRQEGSQLALDLAKKDVPLDDMRRDSEMIAQIARFGVQHIDQVDDAKLPAFAAQLFSDMPTYGAVSVKGGALHDGTRSEPVTRESLTKMLVALSDPGLALELKKSEYAPRQYVVGDQVVTMTPQQAAQTRGARAFSDVNAGVTLGKGFADIATTEAQAVERMAQAGKHKAEAQWIGPKAQAGIAADQALAHERRVGARVKAAEIPGKQAEATEKQAKALRDETDFILKQLKMASGVGGVEALMSSGDVAGLSNMLSVLEAMATNEPQPSSTGGASASKYSSYEQQAATKALQNLQALGYFEIPQPSADYGNAMRGKVGDEVRMASPDVAPVAGARRASDGHWYVQQGGQWFRVRQ